MSVATATKERPILFSGPMVRAILDGRKTQTRRVVKPQQKLWRCEAPGMQDVGGLMWKGYPYEADATESIESACPYGVPRDRLWVREAAWIAPPGWADLASDNTHADYEGRGRVVAYAADDRSGETERCAEDYGIKRRSSIHMPRWASRITLEITGVRVERVDSISTEDAIAEGFEDAMHFLHTFYVLNKRAPANLNPWVWVVEFRRVEP